MSNLLVQNIKHTNNTTSMSIDTSGQISVRGESSATTTSLQQGLVKCWAKFDGEGTVAINDSFNLLKGELSFYIKLADSGAKRELAFCGKCGTRIYAKPENGKSGFFGLRVGKIRQRKSLHPRRKEWKKSCLYWVQGIKTDQTFETQPKIN